VVTVAFSAWVLRRLTHIGWLGSGWPQWAAGLSDDPNRPDEFDRIINELQSYCYFAMIGLNLLPGFFVDFCKKRYARDDNEHYGMGIGLIICFTISSCGMVAHR